VLYPFCSSVTGGRMAVDWQYAKWDEGYSGPSHLPTLLVVRSAESAKRNQELTLE
jgi:hypothetical protein